MPFARGKKLKLPSALVLHLVRVNGIFCGIKLRRTSELMQIGKMINLRCIAVADELNPNETEFHYTKEHVQG